VFTGIIEAVGQIESVKAGREDGRVVIETPRGFGPLSHGESIAVNGVCLTAEDLSDRGFTASVSPETLSRTTLGGLRSGDKANLEQAMALGDRLGGHMVSGHVDAVGRIRSLKQTGGCWNLAVEASDEILGLCIEKGSVAIDGISLTIAALESWGFECAIIPHSFASTNLRWRRQGDPVNLETDLIGKYVQRLAASHVKESKGLSRETLDEHGFV